MEIHEPHGWDVTPKEAAAIQREMRERVSLVDAIAVDDIRVVAGVDNTYKRQQKETTAYAVVVALDFTTMEVIETSFAEREVGFPYVPGLLSFREAPAILDAFRGLKAEPDVILFDGQGIAHPRRIGLASHLGVVLDKPSIGCAKSKLVGEFEEPERVFGAQTPLMHKGEQRGVALRTRPRHAPLFVSPGHKLSIPTAVEIVLRCCRDERFMPEPTRLAHELVTGFAREDRDSGSGIRGH
jgi:deoxyribonuclease V